MKFKKHKYWKHALQTDTFLYVDSVKSDTGKQATINACWMVQDKLEWRFASHVSTMFIDKQEYPLWAKYQPKGTVRL